MKQELNINVFREKQQESNVSPDLIIPTEFIERIDAPENLRGLYFISNTISIVKSEIRDLAAFLKISDAAFSELSKSITELKEEYPSLTNRHKQNGWCDAQPIYALLFEYSANSKIIKNVPTNRLLVSFLSHYWTNESKILSEISKTSSKLKEASGALRLLLQNPEEFDATEIVRSKSSQAKGKALLDLLDSDRNLQLKTRNYIRQLAHFYLLDWKPRKSTKREYSKRRSFGKRNFDVSFPVPNDPSLRIHKRDISELKTIEDAGILPDDLSQDVDVIEVRNPEKLTRPKTRAQLVEQVLDEHKKMYQVFDISNRLQRAHNGHLLDKSLLQPYELIELVKYLNPLNVLEKPDKRQVAVWCCWVMLVTGRSLSEQLTMMFNSATKEGVFYRDNLFGWQFIIMPVTTDAKPMHVALSLPHFMQPLLKQLQTLSEADERLLLPKKLTEKSIEKEIHNLLKLFAKKTQISLSIDKIKHFCLHRIIAVGQQDPVILLYAFGGYSYQTRVTRFYSQIPISNIVAELNKFWHDVKTTINQIDPDWLLPEGLGTFQEVPPLLTAQPLLIGSKVMPSLAELNKLTGRLASPFSTANKAMVQQSIDALINYHNHYVTYTTMMLLAATGYRAVRNPLPLLSLFLPHYHCMVISDKDDEDFTNTRIVAVGSILAQQLN
ncbi:MAG: hypothetical protein NWQ54_08410, partial [Paraglaciecola sp.]|nr:hypothetical protein [Paraglaciecola sp.]